MLRFNRQRIVVEIYSKDRPTFAGINKEQKMQVISVPSPAEIDTWDRKNEAGWAVKLTNIVFNRVIRRCILT